MHEVEGGIVIGWRVEDDRSIQSNEIGFVLDYADDLWFSRPPVIIGQCCSRSLTFCNFPLAVRGSTSVKVALTGHLKWAN